MSPASPYPAAMPATTHHSEPTDERCSALPATSRISHPMTGPRIATGNAGRNPIARSTTIPTATLTSATRVTVRMMLR